MGGRGVITGGEYATGNLGGRVGASAQAVDVASGTTRMQLGLDNAKGELMPGSYANVRLTLQQDTAPLSIPASAMIFNQNGLRVATVGPDDKILFKTVTISRDLGRTIELASGLTAEDRVVGTPPDGIANGDQVRIAGGSTKDKPPAKLSEKQDVKG